MLHPHNGRDDFNFAQPSDSLCHTMETFVDLNVTPALLWAMLDRCEELQSQCAEEDIPRRVVSEFGFQDSQAGAALLRHAASVRFR